ncbi:MAG: PhoH family protein [Flavobacteriales bacterium]|nr:PhoH family protein [Flavobacteriales bacterium]
MAKASSQKKIYVLDTSVILHEHEAVNNFEDNDVAIPIQVLEELDGFKKGNSTISYEARSFIRLLNEASRNHMLSDWAPVLGKGKGKLKVIMHSDLDTNIRSEFDDRKNDNKIILAALSLRKKHRTKKVILVSKDICLRVKAKSLGLDAEDYEAGKIKNLDKLFSGKDTLENVDASYIDALFENGFADPAPLKLKNHADNQFFILKSGKKSVLAKFNYQEKRIERVDKKAIYRIKPRNSEQAFAMDALLNPDIKLITIRGIAGSGKTLLAIACALEQRSMFHQIFVTRPIVPLSNKDLGYLPGDVKDKVDPYMQPIWDNLRYIKSQFSQGDKEYQRIDDLVANDKISVAPLAFIRGRTLTNIFFIVDEAQNLTPHEVKTIISRAGENTKIVFTGDINQIDTPYLDAESNGLSYIIDKVKSHPLFCHITMEKGERSELANLANELL